MKESVSFEGLQAVLATVGLMRAYFAFEEEREQSLVWRECQLIKANRRDTQNGQALVNQIYDFLEEGADGAEHSA